MRFKISHQQGANRHTSTVTCVTWVASDEIYSCGDDHLLMCWRFEGGVINSKKIAELPEDFYPTDMQWHPRPAQPTGVGAIKKQSLDVLLITTADGKFHLINRAGGIEKSVQAHTGATLSGKWSFDGTALFTAGEDGLIKVWSRSGMLRSTAIRGNQEVFASAWSPDSSAILYSQGSFLLIQSLTASSKPNKWSAHEGLILAVAWNQFHGLIVSGGEDCRYKVWDANGNLLYASGFGDQPVTAVNWCFSGNHFAVGSFNTLKLCDKTGWSHSTEKIQAGSIYSIAWSSDGTQVALASSSGSVLIAHTIEKKLEHKGFEAILVKRKSIQVNEIGSDVTETLDIADRVVQLEFGFGHLVVITPSQCHIYSVKNWNTPAIFDLKNGSVSAVLLADKHFLLIEWNMMSLYNYQGRSIGTPKWKNMTSEPLYSPCVSVCCDTLVVRDQTNRKLVHVLEISSKKPIAEGQAYTHVQNVTSLALNYVGGVSDRQLALIDVNRDLFLISIRSAGFGRVCKIAVMAQNIAWATDANVLAGMLDTTLSVWLCPNCVHYSDRKVIRKTRVDKDGSEFGKQPTIVSVNDGLVTVRRGDGALVVSSFYTFFTTLQQHILNGRWEDAVSVCRIVQNETLWTCLAVLAIDSRQLNIAEEACAAIGRYDKVDYIRYIKKMPNETERLAEMSLLAGDLLSAEGILLQNGLIAEAIKMNIQMYNWNRALELALKHKKLLAEVLDSRKRYLEILEKKEVNQSFLAVYNNLAKAQAAKREAKEREREKERAEREKEREMKDKERDKDRGPKENESESEKEAREAREREREREREMREEERKIREEERKIREKERERERELREKEREMREKEREMREKERERERERERQIREMKEKEKERELREMKEREMREAEREKERQMKEAEREREKQMEEIRQREREKELQEIKEKEKELQKLKEKEKERPVKKTVRKTEKDVKDIKTRERVKARETKETEKPKPRQIRETKERNRVKEKDVKTRPRVKRKEPRDLKKQDSKTSVETEKSMTPRG